MLRIILIAMLSSFSGCIYIPRSEPEPFQDRELARIHPGKTTREELVELFSDPGVIRDNGAIWIYGKARRVAYVAGMYPIGNISAGYINNEQFLLVEFEHNTVEHFELVEKTGDCSSTGICLDYGWHHSQQDFYTDDRVLVASKREDDQIAKEFQGVSDKCSLYVYKIKYPLQPITIDSTRNLLLSPTTYLYLPLEPGAHKITTTGYEGGIIEKQIDCKTGSLVFVELSGDPVWKLWVKRDFVIKTVDEDVGRKAVSDMNLILLP